MRKSTITFFIFICCLINVQAITYTETIKHALCNGSNNGSIAITVTSGNPPYSFLWNNGKTDNSISDLPPGTYTVTITDNLSNSVTASFTVKELPCNFKADLYFTPNGDGINDKWHIGGLNDFPDALIIVYNRMGQKIFESRGFYIPWDGTDLFGSPLPDATYFYIVYAHKKNREPAIKGSVSILR